jgi:hypothetical protein
MSDKRGIVADPYLARRGRPSRCGLESRLQGSNYLEFTCRGSTGIPTGINTSGVSPETGARTTRPAWFGSNHAPCLAFNPRSTVYY